MEIKSIEIAKWYNNADSPVLFMIDDFCNKWVDLNGNGRVDLGEDWGYAKDGINSAFNFLKTRLLEEYPYLKVTFFTPVGKKSPVIKQPLCKVYSVPINENDGIKEFFRSLHFDKQFEIVYHGLTHGVPGETAQDFHQEWKTFRSVEEAVKQIEKGKEIYFDTFGEYPKGGKYCGYEYNDFADESINETGFLWWCRDWNRGQDSVPDKLRFELKYFGANKVIDIPSTVSGGLLTIIKGRSTVKYIIKIVLKQLWINWRLKQIYDLLKNKQIISIQEHIAPSRGDGKRQRPNIIDDEESLSRIFQFLKNKNIWYATGSEIAEYFETRENTEILNIDDESFEIKYNGRIRNPVLTLLFRVNKFFRHDVIEIITPREEVFQGNKYSNESYLITLPIENGRYRMKYDKQDQARI